MSALSQQGFNGIIEGQRKARVESDLQGLFDFDGSNSTPEAKFKAAIETIDLQAANRRYPVRRDRDHHHIPDVVHDSVAKRKQKNRGKKKSDTLIKKLRISQEELDAHQQFNAQQAHEVSLLTSNMPYRIRSGIEAGMRESMEDKNTFLFPDQNYSMQVKI